MSSLIQKVKGKMFKNEGTNTSDNYGSLNEAEGHATGGVGQYKGKSGFSSDQTDQAVAGQEDDTRMMGGNDHGSGSGDTYGSGNQSGGQAMQGGGQYPGRVGESIIPQESGGIRDSDSYSSGIQAGGLAAQGGGQYPGRVGDSKVGV